VYAPDLKIPELDSGENFAVDSHLSFMPHVSIQKVRSFKVTVLVGSKLLY
jgi:hypothetical protein